VKGINLYAPDPSGHVPREDEVFYLLQDGRVEYEGWGVDWLYRSVKWTYEGRWVDRTGRECLLHNMWFNSYLLLWFLRWYVGTAKVDGSRTNMLWNGQLGYPVPMDSWVITRTPKEQFSVRLRWRKPDRERPLNMGGIILAAVTCLGWL
jgi:hypothetical protein